MIELTRASVKDHGIVTGLLLDYMREVELKPEADRDQWDRIIAELLNSDGWLFLLARDGEEAVALAVVNFFLSLYGSRAQGRISALVVDESHRHQGIGTRLMEDMLAAARRRGCRELEAVVAPGSPEEAFYTGFGYSAERRLLLWPCRE
jgi:GNAT superfamily N-acetyltransferase